MYDASRCFVDMGAVMESEVERKVYTIDEFCEAYKISVSMFYKLNRANKGPKHYKVGRNTLIKVEDAEKWLESMPTV